MQQFVPFITKVVQLALLVSLMVFVTLFYFFEDYPIDIIFYVGGFLYFIGIFYIFLGTGIYSFIWSKLRQPQDIAMKVFFSMCTIPTMLAICLMTKDLSIFFELLISQIAGLVTCSVYHHMLLSSSIAYKDLQR